MVLGDNDVQPTAAQLEQMKELVRQAMRDGAVGVSTSLEYAPRSLRKNEELIGLAAEASKFGGIYATHMRNEGTGILPAIDEAVRNRPRSSHPRRNLAFQKWVAKPSWGHMPEAIAKVNSARAEGIDISADTYAYTAWFNDFFRFHSRVGPRRGNTKLLERLKDSSDARSHPQRHAHSFRPVGQRMAGNSGP